jgi:hypothetical protein
MSNACTTRTTGGRRGDALNLAREMIAEESFRHEQNRFTALDGGERPEHVRQHREHPP